MVQDLTFAANGSEMTQCAGKLAWVKNLRKKGGIRVWYTSVLKICNIIIFKKSNEPHICPNKNHHFSHWRYFAYSAYSCSWPLSTGAQELCSHSGPGVSALCPCRSSFRNTITHSHPPLLFHLLLNFVEAFVTEGLCSTQKWSCLW